MRVSVPGNLLLLGEYAVLEEGGLGLALAVEKRLELELVPAAAGLSVEGRWPGGALSWTEEQPGSSPLIAAVVEACRGEMAARGTGGTARPGATGGVGGAGALPAARITIDSSAFFAAEGRKSGLGSSAAVAVGLSRALLGSGGVPAAELPAATLRVALRAHRVAQGGSGSGYDVYASCLGGVGLFTGGRQPSWKPVRLPWLGTVGLFHGAASVATPGAVRRYRDWQARSPREAARFLRRSNRGVRRFLAARSWSDAAPWFRALTELGIDLGEAIGVPARIRPPLSLPEGVYKALGAGDELGACLLSVGARGPKEPGGGPGLEAVQIATAGVTWAA